MWPRVQIRHVARFLYGESLPTANRADGDVPVFGSNGQVGLHDRPTSIGPTIIVGRKGSHGKVRYSSVPVFAIDTTYFIDSTVTTADLRWLYYALSEVRLDRLGQDVGVPGLNREAAYSERIPWPSIAAQRAIADFLDAETARIDALIAKKRRLLETLRERLAGSAELQIREVAEEYGEVPLKFTVPEVTVGIVITPARWYSDEGVPAIRGTNVRPGRIDMSDLVHLTAEGHALHQKSALRTGDLMVVRTGQAGSAAVVPKELDDANCVDVLLIRRSAALLPRYLEYVINSDWTRSHIEAHSVGTIQSHFNVASLRELRIPVPRLTTQEAVVRRLDKESDRVERLTSALSRQIHLLTERRQALITAAVTGELDIAQQIAEEAS